MSSIAKLTLPEPSAESAAMAETSEEEGLELVPLSFAQRRLWFLDRLFPEDRATYNVPGLVWLQGDLDVAALKHSLEEIISRHEVLRTAFVEEEGEPMQICLEALALPIPVVDLSALRSVVRRRVARRRIAELICKSFDLARPPLLRVELLHLNEREHVLLVNIHHIVSDAWSMGIFVHELKVLYQAFAQRKPTPLAELPIQYADFTLWQRDWLQGARLEKQLDFWRDCLGGTLPVLELPSDHPHNADFTASGDQRSWRISPRIAENLQLRLKSWNVTLFMALLAAFKAFLYRYTRQEDLLIGTPTASRNRAELEGLIGFFVNTLVLRTTIEGRLTFKALLEQVRQATVQAFEHADMPFDRLVEELQPERRLGRSPIFQIMFSFLHNASLPRLELGRLEMIFEPVEPKGTKFELALETAVTETGLQAKFQYSTVIFSRSTIMRMSQHFERLLEAAIKDPQCRLAELPLLSEAECAQLFLEWNDSAVARPAPESLPHWLKIRAAERPDALAVISERGSLSYGMLHRRADSLAHYLRARGVERESLVGLAMVREPDLLVALLAVMKAGGAYLPLDPAAPVQRIHSVLRDSRCDLLLADCGVSDRLPACQVEALTIEGLEVLLAQFDRGPLPETAAAPDLAYVIYTSGSTGRPKGVLINHGGLLNYSLAVADRYSLQAADRVLQFASVSFDVAAEEIFPTWLSGAAVVLAPERVYLSFQELLKFLLNHRVSCVNLPASYWHGLVAELTPGRCAVTPTLRLVVVGSEAVSSRILNRWREKAGGHIALRNAYGPTEATIGTTLFDPAAQGGTWGPVLPIGRPVDNVRVFLLDSDLQLVPIRVIGELYIGGHGLSRGYLERARLTAEHFLPDPFSDESGARLYRSGDTACYRGDGTIEFVGRVDHQVKIRGFRVELGEIESVLEEHPAVHQAVVLVNEPSHRLKQGISEALDNNLPAAGTERLLEELLALADPEVEEMLTEIEQMPTELTVEERTPLEGRVDSKIRRRYRDFELDLTIKNPSFIRPPSESQRTWSLKRTVDEFVDDLRHLDDLTHRFVEGSSRPTLGEDWQRSQAHYDESQLIIDGQQVMQDWERPLMKSMARAVTENGGDILELGFGLGISATYIQEFGARSHTIVEFNDDVIDRFEQWRSQYPGRNIHLLRGKWQGVTDQLGAYDGIFFDTYPLDEEEFSNTVLNSITFAENFFPTAARCLRKNGIFSYYSNEIDSFSRRHQRLVLKYFESLMLSVVEPLEPPEDCHYWWADSMVLVKAIK